MKVILVFALITLGILANAQTGTQQTSDLVVLKFSCGKYDANSRVVRSVQDPDPPMNEPMTITQTSKNEPQEVKNRRDMNERRAEMKATEMNATLSGQKQSAQYFYRLQFRNSGTKFVKSFAWEYVPNDEPDPLDRQFFCAIKTKPNETKALEVFSPLAPSRVVDASHAGDKPNKELKEKAIINRIEFMDGTVWIRSGWNPRTFSADAIDKVAEGRCVGL